MIDSHLHLNDDALYPERGGIIKRAEERGVKAFVCIGWDYESSVKAVEIAEEFPNVYAAVGVHPENIEGLSLDVLEKIETLAKNKKVVAIGEIGLDHYWIKDPEVHKQQEEWFVRQIKLANKLNLPCSIHGREATQNIYDILKNNPIAAGAVLHCYSGSVEMLNEFAKLGLYFGFDGPITYKNAITPKECCIACPRDRILTETDAPYLPPVPYRGKRNEPQYIHEILSQMATLRGETIADMERIVLDNFERLFRIKL